MKSINTISSRLLILAACLLPATGNASALDGLVGHWAFDDNGNDTSGNGYDLNLVGNPSFGAGRFGQALSLTGDGSKYAVRPVDDPAFNFGSGDFTVQIWANFYSHSTEQVLIEKFTSTDGPGWTFATGPGTTTLHLWGQPAGALYQSHIFPAGEWHQYVARRSGNIASMYIDGVEVNSGTFVGAIPDSLNPLLIGRRNEADGRVFGANGLLDDVAIWNRALSVTEIQSLTTQAIPSAVPIPATAWLLGSGLLGLLGVARKRKST